MIRLAKRRGSCAWCREELRVLVEETPDALSADELLNSAGGEVREHVSDCPACLGLLRDALEARRLLREALTPAAVPEEFAARVMAEIRAREAAAVPAGYAWAAVQSLAARVAWVSALVLLIASTWVYQRHVLRPNPAAPPDTAADRFPEPPPQPTDLDEVLVSLAEAQP